VYQSVFPIYFILRTLTQNSFIPYKEPALKYYQRFLNEADARKKQQAPGNKKNITFYKIAIQRVMKLREDLHFEGKLKEKK